MSARSATVVWLALVVSVAFGLPRTGKDAAAARALLPIVSEPFNDAALAGSTVTLQCGVSWAGATAVTWMEYATTGNARLISTNLTISASHPNRDRYRIIHHMGGGEHFDLQIQNTTVADGGKYECLLTGTAFRRSAELIIMEKDPECAADMASNGVVMEGDLFYMDCKVFFQGNSTPLMTWSGPTAVSPIVLGNATYTMSYIHEVVHRDMDTKRFSCVTNFTDRGFGGGPNDANNVPSYRYSWSSQQMFVYWSPKAMYVQPAKVTYDVGDVVTCYADAHPAASYRWENSLTSEIIVGAVFTVTLNMVDQNQHMRCRAQNNIFGNIFTNYLDLRFNVSAPTTVTPTTTTTTTTTTAIPPTTGACADLTGRWDSVNPEAAMCIEVNTDRQGETVGLYREGNDPFWVEVIGRTLIDNYLHLGLSGIWPYDNAVVGFAGECQRCGDSVERIYANIVIRNNTAQAICSNGGTAQYPGMHTFTRTLAGVCRLNDMNIWRPGMDINSPQFQKPQKRHPSSP